MEGKESYLVKIGEPNRSRSKTNNNETDDDCDGNCTPIRKCLINSNCKNHLCVSNICLQTDLNCDGTCALSLKCNISSDCKTDLCFNNSINHCKPNLLITFGSDDEQFLNITISIFNFTADYSYERNQKLDNMKYTFVSLLNNSHSHWQRIEMDYTPNDIGGYSTVNNLCAYIMNLDKIGRSNSGIAGNNIGIDDIELRTCSLG
ncbi:hypothetical protein I4U23_021988 [Adineta vaga]|nr:hypothetical protein I4U23_021988 [Adineta vaga]